jgi:hypothetical protein
MAYYRSLFLSSLAIAALCGACGSKFDAVDAGGAGGLAGSTHVAGSGGDTTSGGGSSGAPEIGGTNSGGSNSGGTTTGAGGANAAGAGGGAHAAGAGGAGASAGAPAGGGTSTGGTGGSGGADCTTLKAEYSAAVEKARVCDAGSTDECSASSSKPALGCGCATLVNAKSPYTLIAQNRYDDIQAAKCSSGPICNIACPPATGASCAAEASSASTTYVCTSSLAVAN